MDIDTFWKLIEDAKAQSGGEIERQAEILTAILATLPESKIVGFDTIYTEFEDRAYRADLWDAANLIYGWCGDDAFTDVRGLVIAQGKDTYERVLVEPDLLADIVSINDYSPFESFSYVALHAYEMKMGEDAIMPNERKPTRHDLIGEFMRSEEEIRAHFPRIASKFSDRPKF